MEKKMLLHLNKKNSSINNFVNYNYLNQVLAKKNSHELTLDVKMPFNTNALVYITGNLFEIKKPGKSISELSDIYFIKKKNAYFIFWIGSGIYQFSASLAKPSF